MSLVTGASTSTRPNHNNDAHEGEEEEESAMNASSTSTTTRPVTTRCTTPLGRRFLAASFPTPNNNNTNHNSLLFPRSRRRRSHRRPLLPATTSRTSRASTTTSETTTPCSTSNTSTSWLDYSSLAHMPGPNRIVPRTLHPWSVHAGTRNQWMVTLGLPIPTTTTTTTPQPSHSSTALRYVQYEFATEREARKFGKAYAPPKLQTQRGGCVLCQAEQEEQEEEERQRQQEQQESQHATRASPHTNNHNGPTTTTTMPWSARRHSKRRRRGLAAATARSMTTSTVSSSSPLSSAAGLFGIRPCRNCGIAVCPDHATQWGIRMLPKTYWSSSHSHANTTNTNTTTNPPTSSHTEPVHSSTTTYGTAGDSPTTTTTSSSSSSRTVVRVCQACDWLSNAFCLSLLQGRYADAVEVYQTVRGRHTQYGHFNSTVDSWSFWMERLDKIVESTPLDSSHGMDIHTLDLLLDLSFSHLLLCVSVRLDLFILCDNDWLGFGDTPIILLRLHDFLSLFLYIQIIQGNVNLRTCFADIHQEAMFPVHCAVMGGSLDCVQWLVEKECCPIRVPSKQQPNTNNDSSNTTTTWSSVQTSASRTVLDLAMTGRPKWDILAFLVQKGGLSLTNHVKDKSLVSKTLEAMLLKTPWNKKKKNKNKKHDQTNLLLLSALTESATTVPLAPTSTAMIVENDDDEEEEDHLHESSSSDEHHPSSAEDMALSTCLSCDSSCSNSRMEEEEDSLWKEDDDDENACHICFDQPMDCVFTPCGHFMCCFECGSKVQSCPVCKVSCSALRIYKC